MIGPHSMATWRTPPADARMTARKKRPGSLFPTSRAVILATSYSRTTYRRTTIGAAAFHFRVRNGNGWGHCAMITRSEPRKHSGLTSGELRISDCRVSSSGGQRPPLQQSDFKEQNLQSAFTNRKSQIVSPVL